MIDTVTGCFEITQYDEKIAISTANLVETAWLNRYPKPIEIVYNQGSEFIGNEFRKSPIEKIIQYNCQTKNFGEYYFQ